MLDPQKNLSILASNYRGEESGKNTYTEISHTSESFAIESAIKKKNVDGLEKWTHLFSSHKADNQSTRWSAEYLIAVVVSIYHTLVLLRMLLKVSF